MVNRNKKYFIGSKHLTNEDYIIEIINIINERQAEIKFLDKYGHIKKVYLDNICTGRISNPYHKSNNSVGYIGVGSYSAKDISYKYWDNMMTRAYNDNFLVNRPTYKNVTVCEDWLNFQTYAKWHEENYLKIDGVNFQLDKDLLQQGIENKIYSPNTCVFLPIKINSYISKDINSGVFWYESRNKWMGYVGEFGIRKRIHLGYFKTKEECEAVVRKAKMEQDESAKNYLRSLNYLPEEIIQLIRTV